MKKKGLLSLIKSDIAIKQHWFLKKKGWFVRNVRVFLEPGTIAVIVYRFGHWTGNLKIPVLKHLLLLFYMLAKTVVVLSFGIHISPKLKVGTGFAIHNFSGIFLPPSIVGDNFIVFQGVTVGYLRGQGGSHPPKIGNNVFIGAGAKVLGNITIGNNVVIGANSLVINDVPDNSTVIGVPARIFSRANWIQEKLEGKGDHW